MWGFEVGIASKLKRCITSLSRLASVTPAHFDSLSFNSLLLKVVILSNENTQSLKLNIKYMDEFAKRKAKIQDLTLIKFELEN